MDAEAAKFMGAGIAMGVGALGPGLGLGMHDRQGAREIARQPEVSGDIRTTMFIGIGVTEAVALYAFVVALILHLRRLGRAAPTGRSTRRKSEC